MQKPRNSHVDNFTFLEGIGETPKQASQDSPTNHDHVWTVAAREATTTPPDSNYLFFEIFLPTILPCLDISLDKLVEPAFGEVESLPLVGVLFHVCARQQPQIASHRIFAMAEFQNFPMKVWDSRQQISLEVFTSKGSPSLSACIELYFETFRCIMCRLQTVVVLCRLYGAGG